MPPLDEPIILIGTHRSGTTFLGEVFQRHAQLAYWVEPRHVWTWGNGYRPDDVLTADDATPRIRRHIHRAFARYVGRHGGERLCEKTPSNCLRIPFIRAVYPDARIIHIIRDGRAVIRSTNEILAGGVPSHRILRRAMQTPPWEWPAYVPQALAAIKRKFTRKPLDFWGPRPPGWREWVGRDPNPVILARQWAGTITRAIEDGRAIGADGYYEFRYEDLLREPRRIMEQLVAFAGLPQSGEMVEYVVGTVDPSRTEVWRAQLDEETLDLLRPHLEPTLNMLGYSW